MRRPVKLMLFLMAVLGFLSCARVSVATGVIGAVVASLLPFLSRWMRRVLGRVV